MLLTQLKLNTQSAGVTKYRGAIELIKEYLRAVKDGRGIEARRYGEHNLLRRYVIQQLD